MVHLDERFPAYTFYCFRFMINCCAADATPLGVMIEYEEAKNFVPGTWVEVKGVFEPVHLENGMTIPRVLSKSITEIDEPEYPYVM